ncbi:uncharacterized protein [Chiloscyllium punctatum]|uniref:uncharacterized protein isoform X2 n=1 Tax=Chiloscyllium punctatum TaxID=137246 RepID=UPI003B631B4A
MEKLQSVNPDLTTGGSFYTRVLNLKSIPVACLYIAMIIFSTYWQKYTKPLELQKFFFSAEDFRKVVLIGCRAMWPEDSPTVGAREGVDAARGSRWLTGSKE